MRSKIKNGLMLLVSVVLLGLTSSCSDDPDSSNYYTFTGEMMSDYLRENADFSDYYRVVERAGLVDLLSTYGKFTCFAPTNEAFATYLQQRGLSSVEELTDEECDTIAKTHLVDNMYATSDMPTGTLPTPNMNQRYFTIDTITDANNNPTLSLNKKANIVFSLKDDSVENGIMQPIDAVLDNTSLMLGKIIQDNPHCSLFYQALKATGLEDSLYLYRDENYNAKDYPRYRYTSHVNKETATAPDDKHRGFTCFIPTDEVLKEKYNITDLRGLYDKACEIYDVTYPESVGEEGHSFDHLTDSVNPLRRFIEYHILDRDVIGWNYLTPLAHYSGKPIGIRTQFMNPQDWYTTMLPHTMMKFDKVTVLRYVGNSTLGQHYINRRYDDNYQIEGTLVQPSVEKEYDQRALNGMYFYINDILSFSTQTRDIVDNVRMRMDMSTVFPELMTQNIRQNGDVSKQDPDFDETAKYGRNYYFPQGYLKGVTVNGYFIYRRPHDYYDSYEGDEMNLFGNFDITFLLPPVPFEGDWQVRLGFAAESTRGIAQIYYGTTEDLPALKPQGIPIDMRKSLSDQTILGTSWTASINNLDFANLSRWSTANQQVFASEQKTLKNLGYYRGPAGGYHYNSGRDGQEYVWATQPHTYRRVLCTVHMKPNEDHYLRIRAVSSKMGNDNEFMMDYIELVPKSVYGVSSGGGDGIQMEDAL